MVHWISCNGSGMLLSKIHSQFSRAHTNESGGLAVRINRHCQSVCAERITSLVETFTPCPSLKLKGCGSPPSHLPPQLPPACLAHHHRTLDVIKISPIGTWTDPTLPDRLHGANADLAPLSAGIAIDHHSGAGLLHQD